MDEFDLEELGPPPAYEDIVPPLTLPRLYPSRQVGKPRTSTVTKDQCAAHLKFLAVLASLRKSISSQDGLFGLWDLDATSAAPDDRQILLARIREKRWAVYTSRAADRYWAWWRTCVPNSRPRPKLSAFRTYNYLNVTRVPGLSLDRVFMPPLDVLMVWHSHMLNPRAFLEDCIRYGKMSFWATEFPLALINDCTDDRNLAYRPGGAAEDRFMSKTRRAWHNEDDPNIKVVECPLCECRTEVPWSVGDCAPLQTIGTFARFYGFADRSFKVHCRSCRFLITHDALKVSNFRDDLYDLLHRERPMPGSYYNSRGMPEGIDMDKDWLQSFANLYPNISLKVIGKDLLRSTRPGNERQTMDHVLNEIHRLLNDRSTLKRLPNRPHVTTLASDEKETFCRVISTYWSNTSRFSIDLASAVICQGTFVDKMDHIDWIHSSNLMGLMDRFIEKYKVFFAIMVLHPFKRAVPTLDVDLVWHTHQLSAFRYYEYSTYQTSLEDKYMPIFINHGDKIGEEHLSDAFEFTSAMYNKLTYGLIYSQCNCWYCEVTRAPEIANKPRRSSLSMLFSHSSASDNRASQAARATNIYDSRHISPNPDKNAHISAHNAVPANSSLSIRQAMSKNKAAALQRNYERACRRVGKKPNKVEAVQFSPNAPYMSDLGIHSDAYAFDPFCTSWPIYRSFSCSYTGTPAGLTPKRVYPGYGPAFGGVAAGAGLSAGPGGFN